MQYDALCLSATRGEMRGLGGVGKRSRKLELWALQISQPASWVSLGPTCGLMIRRIENDMR